MELHPDYIKENLDQIGKKEGLALLREWIDSSSEPEQRQKALINYGLIDEGKNFKFFEHLYLSDEDIKLRLIAGNVLKEKHLNNKKFIHLLKYTLNRLDNVELQIFAIITLNSIADPKARKILVEYLKESIKKDFESKIKDFPKEIFDYNDIEAIPKLFLDLCVNIILYKYYTIKCGYHVSLKKGKISYLNCESSNLTKITDINSLDWLIELEHLHLHRNYLVSLDGIQILNNLRTLDVSHNKLEKIENIDGLLQLEELNLSNNRIQKVEGIDTLSNLKKLSLNQNSIGEIENLCNLRNLESLELTHNKIKKINNLDLLIGLKRLNLSFNRIEKITGLQNLKNLTWLSLNNNKISKIEGLIFLEKLNGLYLSNNLIEKIEGCENLLNLKKLELSNNRIKKIEGLQNLKELQELYLDNNKLNKVRNLECLQNLIMLHLGRNNISEFSRESIENLKSLNFIFLNENPLDQKSSEEYHKRLKFP
ncbi:MAG: leucine-rich repeat protein [Promethearchaeota archaeon]|nr:MAG: leucine-rich repeat protein [Candidatus Lokiarchaeota archaeon]